MSIIYPIASPINLSGFATTGSNTFIGDQTITGNVNLIGALEDYSAKIAVPTATSGVINQFSASHNVAKFTYMAETTTGTYHVQAGELILAHNDSQILITPYAFGSTKGNFLALFDAQINGSNIEIIAKNIVSDDLTVTMTKTYLS